ncbi:hypothetical protein [Rhizocola hellebori]|uniref:hypothetical protein n=1 Tax=Rhizocola hellebori TaxID=1392758 RepID=UPI0019414FF6|nr:hypothetical protein [Rhizocola hellebori]
MDYEPQWQATGTKPDVSLSAALMRQGDGLAIRYTLLNQGEAPVVAYVGVPGDAASHSYDVFVTAREDKIVEIAKRTFAIPPGTNADAVGTIEGIVIPGGEQFTEEFRVPWPLKGNRPYVSEVKLPDPVTTAVFCIGVLLQSEAPAPKPADRGRGAYPLNGPQHLFCSDPANVQ